LLKADDVGTVILSGSTNDYTGTTTVLGGTLQLNHAAALGNTTDITVPNGSTLNLNNIALNNTSALSLSGILTGTGTSSMGNAITLNSTHEIGGSGVLTLSGQLTGNNGLNKNS